MRASETPGPFDDSRQLSVLVVDDDPILRMVLRRLTESLGCVVEEAVDGEAAIEALRETTDLVLLDLLMPGMGGVETCRAIRGGTTNPHVLVCVVSSSTDPVIHGAARSAGVDEILTKPISKDRLAAAVARAKSRRAAEVPGRSAS